MSDYDPQYTSWYVVRLQSEILSFDGPYDVEGASAACTELRANLVLAQCTPVCDWADSVKAANDGKSMMELPGGLLAQLGLVH